MKSIYLAGPMRGIPHFNFPMFAVARYTLRKQGHHVFCPAENDIRRHGYDISLDNPTGNVEEASGNHGFDLEQALHEDLSFIAVGGCTTIALLPGWEFSSGCFAEFMLARALKREFMYL